MARNYQVEAIQKYPVTTAPPLKDNYTNDAAYQQDFEEFQRQHATSGLSMAMDSPSGGKGSMSPG